ncbi:MAG: 5-oxoprolinase subunit PxpB [Gemmatimonadaceae bacterium]
MEILPLGEAAMTLVLGGAISVATSDRVALAAHWIRATDIAGVTDVVAAYASVAVHFDPRIAGYMDLRERIMALDLTRERQTAEGNDTVTHLIPVTYDGEDLAHVADIAGLTPADVVQIHSAAEYRVLVIGFVPGFAYLGPLDARLTVARRASPRRRVPAGSVAIAEAQTGIYPAETPGGWHLLGRTSTVVFDPTQDSPALFAVGDHVRFVPA